MGLTPAGMLKNNSVIAAPMAGVTDKTYRVLAKEAGCGLVVTEMVSAKALVYNNQRTFKLVEIAGEKPPIAVQLFGSDPVAMAEAAVIIQGLGADMVDINMGCPTPKIVRSGEGSALMKTPLLAKRIVASVSHAVTIPVSVKIRAGWDKDNVNAPSFAAAMVDAGAAMVTVHGRTREQFYSGKASWEVIKEVKNSVPVPVVGNGDIWAPADAARMLAVTGCDGVMVGRGALGNPWIFNRITKFLITGEMVPPPTAEEKINMALRHLDMMVDAKGQYTAVREMRKHVAWYIKGLWNATKIREIVNKQQDVMSLKRVLKQYKEMPDNLPLR
ncbi:tRNA dihydrouridine synthase DusB [Metallumcola ferriviriculae]|uniref:tRNA-dihydrouridine synthase n=1 Tax=Metallumcola ferriviriculae TaxID=3039180 RepID=A0AAU0UHC6_9FIRM|nr:tRNA dihydrouridine synthase DusB [Desulfitibacteraceae bacterium MK1]